MYIYNTYQTLQRSSFCWQNLHFCWWHVRPVRSPSSNVESPHESTLGENQWPERPPHSSPHPQNINFDRIKSCPTWKSATKHFEGISKLPKSEITPFLWWFSYWPSAVNKKHDNKINHLSYKKRKPPICQQKKRNFTQHLSPARPLRPHWVPQTLPWSPRIPQPRARPGAMHGRRCPRPVFIWFSEIGFAQVQTWILISGKSRIASTWSWSSSSSSSSSPPPSLSSIPQMIMVLSMVLSISWWTDLILPDDGLVELWQTHLQPLLPWPWLSPHNNVHSSTFVIRY